MVSPVDSLIGIYRGAFAGKPIVIEVEKDGVVC